MDAPDAAEPGHQTQRVEIEGSDGDATPVDVYWGEHTVNSTPFGSAEDSERYLEWRFSEYPLFREFSGLWGEHPDEVVLDFGCGPGDDVVGFLLYSGARSVVGLDASRKALGLLRDRLELHAVDPARIRLIHTPDGETRIPLADASVDFVNCQGVLHHTSDPQAVLREFARVMKAGAHGNIMVYNRDSVWFHLYTAYERMILEGRFEGLDVEAAFARNTDGPECPISRCYTGDQFTTMCADAGLMVDWIGGYISRQELSSLRQSWVAALADQRLGARHREFLRELDFDLAGYPRYRGRHAGIGGAYRLLKPG